MENKPIIKNNAEVNKNPKEEKTKDCYVCGADLFEFFKTDMSKQDGLNSPPKVPQMIKYNGVREMVCPDCYKASVTGLQVYRQKNPSWVQPK